MRYVLAALLTLPAAHLAEAQQRDSLEAEWATQQDLQTLIELGRSYDSAWALYQAFLASGPEAPSKAELPDWTGLWVRAASPFYYDPDQTRPTTPDLSTLPEQVELEPRYAEELAQRVRDAEEGNAYDPISVCGVAGGFPRWLTYPQERDFAITPAKTLMSNAHMNETRRIYTDGRGHIAPDLAQHTPLGDTIGFWDGDKLVAHTTYVEGTILTRQQPLHSDEAETVEIWYRVDDDTIHADVWLYDPMVLEAPWFTRQVYNTLQAPEGPIGDAIRIQFWECAENPNNAITLTEEGGSTFTDFTFTEEDDKQ